MAAIVVPFRGAAAKLRLAPMSGPERGALALAMLGDVLAACRVVGATTVVTDDAAAAALARELGCETVDDPGGGQGVAVAAAIDGRRGSVLVVNADVPCVVPRDVRALARAIPDGGLAFVQAKDGTTNALGLDRGDLFAPLYGPGSADRFRAHVQCALAVAIPNIADDVDT